MQVHDLGRSTQWTPRIWVLASCAWARQTPDTASVAATMSASCAPPTTQLRHVRASIIDRALELKGERAVFLCHQTNVDMATRDARLRAAGVARQVFAWWPAADDYARRCCAIELGQARPHEVEGGAVTVVNMYAQQFPGAPKRHTGETRKTRLDAFRTCMEAACALALSAERHAVVLLPCIVGCYRGGGRPADYVALLRSFCRVWGVSIELCCVNRARCQYTECCSTARDGTLRPP